MTFVWIMVGAIIGGFAGIIIVGLTAANSKEDIYKEGYDHGFREGIDVGIAREKTRLLLEVEKAFSVSHEE